ncbi:MAG: hypothetical protein HYR94_07770 [Chloroflexi bacterium]|nr:hypothetical protein [Chloroflexota bacterium]
MIINKYYLSHKLLTLILGLVLAVTSCQTENNVPDSDVPTPPPTNQATPVSSVSESPLPTVVSSIAESPVPPPIPEATAVSKPAAGKGSVSGALIWLLKNNYYPANLAILYLAPVLEGSDGVARLASLDKENDPMARADEFGRFAFLDIEPGTYALIFSLPGRPEAMVNKLGHEGADFLIEVKAGEVTQLDEITAEYPFGD